MVNASATLPHSPRSAPSLKEVGHVMQPLNPLHSKTKNASAQSQRHTKRPRNRPTFLLLFVTSGLFCLAITLYGLAGLLGDSLSRGGHSASKDKLEIVVANSVLNVPENIIRFSSQRRAGTHRSLELYLHWPTLSGYDDRIKEYFSGTNTQSSLLFLSIEPRSMSLDMSGRIGPIYSKFFNGVPSKGIGGLVRQPLTPEGGFIDEDLYYESGSPYPFAARCVRVGSTVATPFCIRDIHIGKDLMLTYRFHIKHLPDWLSIDEQVRIYVNSLLVRG